MKNANSIFSLSIILAQGDVYLNKENWCEALPKPCVAFGNKADAKRGSRRKFQQGFPENERKQKSFLVVEAEGKQMKNANSIFSLSTSCVSRNKG